MNLNQQSIHDFITRQLDLLRYEKTVRAEIFSLLDTMQTSVAEKLGNPNAQAVIDGVEKILNDGYALVLKALDVLPVLDAEFLWLYGWLGGLATAYQLRDKVVPFTKKAVNKIAQSFTLGGLTLPESVGKQRDDLLLKLKSLVRSADEKLGFSDLADTFNRAKQHAQTLSKTWINAVQNTAHEAFGRVNPLVKAYRHVSVLDGDTSAVCTFRNGLLWNKKHEPIGHKEVFKRPPLHPNCRSKLVYVFNLKDKFQGVSGDDWVQSRNLKELQEQFGVGIGQMLFDGKIKLRDAVDGLKPVTLEVLQEKLDWKRFIFPNGRQTYTLGDRTFSALDLAKLSGAVDGSEIFISQRVNHFIYNSPVLDIFAEHEIYDGRLHRTISINGDGSLILHNEMQFLRKQYQSKGIATNSLEKQIDIAKNLGIESIETYAIRSETSNGYYTWARLGFDAELTLDILGKLPTELSNAKRISDLMQTEQGRQWWFDNGVSHDMTFDLHDSGSSIKIFKQYLENHRKKNHG